jgi:hypothetical protein
MDIKLSTISCLVSSVWILGHRASSWHLVLIWGAAHVEQRLSAVGLVMGSWTLLVCDVILVLYLLVVSLFILLVGTDITTNVVTNALIRYHPPPFCAGS